MIRCSTSDVFIFQNSNDFSIVCMIWYGCVQSPPVSKRQYVRWCSFRWSILLSFDYVYNWFIGMAISTPSCSYCIWNIYCQNHRILPNFLLFVWFDTVQFNRMPCSNNKMYDDVVFADRFRYQLTMFEGGILTELSRLLDTFIAYEIVV